MKNFLFPLHSLWTWTNLNCSPSYYVMSGLSSLRRKYFKEWPQMSLNFFFNLVFTSFSYCDLQPASCSLIYLLTGCEYWIQPEVRLSDVSFCSALVFPQQLSIRYSPYLSMALCNPPNFSAQTESTNILLLKKKLVFLHGSWQQPSLSFDLLCWDNKHAHI